MGLAPGFAYASRQCVYDGPEIGSTGQRVSEWTARQGRSR